MTIGKRILLYMGVGYLIILAGQVVSFRGFSVMNGHFVKLIEKDQAKILAYVDMYANGLQMGQAVRNITLNPKDEKAKANLKKAAEEFQKAHDDASALADNQGERALLADIADKRKKQEAVQAAILEKAQVNQWDAVLAINASETPLWREIRSALLKKIDEDKKATKEEKATTLASADKAMITSVALTALSIVIGAVLVYLLIRSIVGKALHPLTEAAEKIVGGAISEANLDYKSGDELGKLADAFRSIVEGQKMEIEIATRLARGEWNYVNAEARSDQDELMPALQEMISRNRHLIGVINNMAKGDFSDRVDVRCDRDDLSRALLRMDEDTHRIITLANQIAAGDLTVDVQSRSDKDELCHALQTMVESMSGFMEQVSQGVAHIATGAGDISLASQNLSQGAAKSATSLNEVTTYINQIGDRAKTNAENATVASKLTVSARTSAEIGNAEMGEMLDAIKKVQKAGEEIAKVVKMIDDIAFQTNMLSLNAAVEAARAGKHGKGFAVVAEAVRNLASDSANAAKETATLVEEAIKLIDQSNRIAGKTADAFKDIVNNSVKASDLVGEIASASQEQAQSVHEISDGLRQINDITRQNSATAEQTAATTAELSGKTGELRKLVSRFRLKSGHNVEYYEAESREAGEQRKLAVARKGYLPLTNTDRGDERPHKVIALDDDEFNDF